MGIPLMPFKGVWHPINDQALACFVELTASRNQGDLVPG